jgi:hypothetical protein
METELTIEYGKNLKTRKVIHQELLCCHSQKAQDLYKKAKIQREAYSSANEMRKKLKEYTAPYMSEKAFEEQHIEKLVRVPCRITQAYLKIRIGHTPNYAHIRSVSSDHLPDQHSKTPGHCYR